MSIYVHSLPYHLYNCNKFYAFLSIFTFVLNGWIKPEKGAKKIAQQQKRERLIG